MVREENNKGITAIVPSYNEAERIGRVLDILTTHKNINEVIVVDDGSTDNTEEIVQKYEAIYVKTPYNQGKGAAMDAGVNVAKGNIILFVDADVRGLTHDTVDEIITPVTSGQVDMFIGMRNRKIYYLHIIMSFIPLLGGERALTKDLWLSLPSYYKHRFRVEAGLNFYAKHYSKGYRYKVVKGLTQVIKEKKYGFFQGMKQRLGMLYNIATAQFRLRFIDAPKLTRNAITGKVKRQNV